MGLLEVCLQEKALIYAVFFTFETNNAKPPVFFARTLFAPVGVSLGCIWTLSLPPTVLVSKALVFWDHWGEDDVKIRVASRLTNLLFFALRLDKVRFGRSKPD
jgi:hypothetical protein